MDIDVKAMSLDELSNRVRQKFNEFVNPSYEAGTGNIMPSEYWVVDIYPDSLVCAERNGEYYRVPYTLTNGDITFTPKEQWMKVEKEWVDANYPTAISDSMKHFQVAQPTTPLMNYGSEVKALGNGKVGGYLVLFGEPNTSDFVGDFFRKSTDYVVDLNANPEGAVRYQHKFDPVLRDRRLGNAKIGADEVGIWIEGQLDLKDRYDVAVYKLVQQRKLGWSSAAKDDVIREPEGKAYFIKRWPLDLDDFTLTPTPADYRQVAELKSIDDSNIEQLINSQAEDDAKPEAQATVTDEQSVSSAVDTPETVPAEVKSHSDIQALENNNMSENQQPPVQDGFEAQLKAMGAQLENITKFLDNMPVSQNPGYVSADGGAADKNIKSMGDFLVAVRRHDVKRLETVYESKALTEDIGGSGGYLIPDEYQQRLLEVAAQNSQIVAQVENIPVTSPTGKIPALDMFFTPTAGDGQTAFAGGINPAPLAEGGAYSASDPNVELVEWRIGKIGFKTTVSNELMSDSPISMEALLTRLAGVAIGAKTEAYILRGNGVNVPLGILNAPCSVSQSAASSNTFAYVDASNMLSRHMATSNRVFWLMHKSTIPDITKFEVGTGGAVWIANVSAGMGTMPLLGYPIIFSEHLPKADSSGHVILADLAAYLLFTKGNMTVAYSEHADFGNGNVVWRFDRRLDGQPWMKSAITDANPGGSYTTSPFVYFNN